MTAQSTLTNLGRLSPAVLIRISSILMLVTALGHLSAYPWTASTHDPRESILVESMKQIRYVFFSNTPYAYFGEHTSYWGLYFGWGLLVGIQLLTSAAVLWFLSGLAHASSRNASFICGAFSATSLCGAVLSLRFFCTPPLVTYSATCILLMIAALQLSKRPGQQ